MWLCCSATLLILGALFVVLGIWGMHLNHRFTPVYNDIDCQLEMPVVRRMWFDGPLWFGMHIRMDMVTLCQNPNSYSVKITSSKSSAFYLGKNRSPAGNITRIPEATLPPGGVGKIYAELLLSPTAEILGSSLAMMLGVQVPLYLENNLEVDIDAQLLFAHIKARRSIDKDCGMNLKFKGLMHPKLGPMSCADSWDQLTLQGLTEQQGL